MSSQFNVQVDAFSGPLELLLELVEARKLFINDVSLASVTDEYIAYIQNTEGVSLTDRSQFVLVASTLLLIKSRSLIPSLELTESEEADIHSLQLRISRYQVYREYARILEGRCNRYTIHVPQQKKRQLISFSPGKTLTLETISTAMSDMGNQLPKAPIPKDDVSVKRTIRLEDVVNDLAKRIAHAARFSYRDFKKESPKDRVQEIVSFLALLELVRQEKITVTQKSTFDDIIATTDSVSVPTYGE